jgi:hypothetical protein
VNPREAYDRAVEKLAAEYAERGFHVRKNVKLPFAVTNGPSYRGDLVAEREDEHHVIGVVLRGVPAARQARRWGEIAREVRSHRGWHFRILLVEPERPAVSDPERIAVEIENTERLLDLGMTNAALLLAYSVFEASAQRRLMAIGAPAMDDTPVELATRLVSEGALDQEDFVPLRDAIEQRNAVAHGHLDPPANRETVERLVATARRLLAPDPRLPTSG